MRNLSKKASTSRLGAFGGSVGRASPIPQINDKKLKEFRAFQKICAQHLTAQAHACCIQLQ
jgi:hypothetical protein